MKFKSININEGHLAESEAASMGDLSIAHVGYPQFLPQLRINTPGTSIQIPRAQHNPFAVGILYKEFFPFRYMELAGTAIIFENILHKR
jgi:hypothetical protein